MEDRQWAILMRLRDGFTAETAHPNWPFDPACPAYGQCGAAALASQLIAPDVEIYKGRVGPWTHYICKLGEHWFDLTADQFKVKPFCHCDHPYSGVWKLVKIKDKGTHARAEQIIINAFGTHPSGEV
jgi:hypothetical protein